MLGFQPETRESATPKQRRFVPPAGPASRKRDDARAARIAAVSLTLRCCMIRLNRLALVVGSYGRSCDWYTRNLGLKVEFEIPERNTVALQDDSGLTLFLSESEEGAAVATCTMAFEVDDVEAKHRELAARGV